MVTVGSCCPSQGAGVEPGASSSQVRRLLPVGSQLETSFLRDSILLQGVLWGAQGGTSEMQIKLSSPWDTQDTAGPGSRTHPVSRGATATSLPGAGMLPAPSRD